MKVHNYLILLILLQANLAVAQTGIGTREPDKSAVLDLSSTSKGLLMPRMSTDERNLIKKPANALIIYNTTTQTIEFNTGTKSNPNWVLVTGNTYDGNPKQTVYIGDNIASGAIYIGSMDDVAHQVYVSGEVSLANNGKATIDNEAVISKKLTGYKIASGQITASDNIIEAIQKLEGNQIAAKVVTTTDDYSIKSEDGTIFCDNSMRAFTITLPEPETSQGKVYVINKIDETYNKLNIEPPIQLNNRNTVSSLNYPKSFKIQSDGKVWHIIN
jgi:hypothetical protein